MRAGSWWLLAGCVVVLGACGDDDKAADKPDGFMLDGEEMGEPDQEIVADMAPDQEIVEDMAPDQEIVVDMEALSFEQQLVAAQWVAIVEVEAVGDGSVGAAAGLEFEPDGTMALHGEGTRRGKWQALQDGSVYVFDLVPTSDEEFEEVLLDPLKQGDAVAALTVRGAPQIRFEQHELRSAREFTVSDLAGRWQEQTRRMGDDGAFFSIAMRVNTDATFEYGITSQGNFLAFLTGPGATLWGHDQRSFWYFVPPANVADAAALAGRITRGADGELRLYAPFEVRDAQGQETILSVELRKVTQFTP